MSRAVPALIGVALLAAACGGDDEAAFDVVVMDAEPGLGLQLDGVRVSLTRLDGAEEETAALERPAGYAGGRLRPQTFRLTPADPADPGRTLYRVRAEGLVAGEVVVGAQHRLTFVPGRTVTLPIRFAPPCVTVSCAAEQTCRSGRCTDDFVPACVFERADDPACPSPFEEPPSLDAGGPDGAPPQPAEAGIDAGEPDTGGPDDAGSSDAADGGSADAGSSDAADAAPEAGTCACRDDGDPCTVELCRDGGCVRAPAPDSTACDDGDACTVADACRGGSCRGSPTVCPDDGRSCTTESCRDGRCSSTVAIGCLVDGACVSSGVLEPGNACRTCDPAASRTSWSPVAAGASCDDGLFCTDTDRCDGAGACVGAGSPCDGGIVAGCRRSCDEALDACVVPPGMCSIGVRCYAAGETSATNPCMVCDPATSQTAWTPRPLGAACDDGRACTAGDTCRLDGTCGGVTMLCATPRVCTEPCGSCLTPPMACLMP